MIKVVITVIPFGNGPTQGYYTDNSATQGHYTDP